MGTMLTTVEARILGSLIEKQATTPDAYPLTLNSLVAACNQKSSRDPVMKLDPGQVQHALRQLQTRELVRVSPAARAERWEHRVDKVLDLVPSQLTVLALLMLRGPQTVSELHARSERMHRFPDLDAVRQALGRLAEQDRVKQLDRQPGQREARWAHLLAGEPQAPAREARAVTPTPESGSDLAARVEALEARVAELDAQVRRLLSVG